MRGPNIAVRDRHTTVSSPQSTVRSAMNLLQVRGLVKHYGGVPAVDGLDLDVAAGQILAVIGPNGAGKSTLLRLLMGQIRPTAVDRVTLDGRSMVGLSAHRVRHAGIAMAAQTPRHFSGLTVLENAAVGAMFAAGKPRREPVALRDARWALELVGLSARAHARPTELTLQERRLLEFARVLAGHPRLVLLDEVMAGLNQAEIERFAGVLTAARRELGLTVLWVEHVMPAVTLLADRVCVLQLGRVLTEGTPSRVLADRRVVAAYLAGPVASASDADPTAADPSDGTGTEGTGTDGTDRGGADGARSDGADQR